MGLVYASLYLVGLTLLGLLGIWYFFFKLPKGSNQAEITSAIDRDLIKTKDHANIHNSRFYILALALLIVSIYTFKLITFREVTIHEIVKKKKRSSVNDIVEIEIPPIEILDPEPPKPQVVFVPKVVEQLPDKPQKDSIPDLEEDDFFDDEEEEDDLPEEETKKEIVLITDQPGVMPEFINGGEPGLENTVVLMLEDEMANFDPGFYPISLSFVVELNGLLSNIHYTDESEIENKKMGNLVIDAVRRAGRWTPGEKDGQKIRVIMEKPFFIEIE